MPTDNIKGRCALGVLVSGIALLGLMSRGTCSTQGSFHSAGATCPLVARSANPLRNFIICADGTEQARSRLSPQFVVGNSSTSSIQVKLASRSCSCVEVLIDGVSLESTSVTVAPKAEVVVMLHARDLTRPAGMNSLYAVLSTSAAEHFAPSELRLDYIAEGLAGFKIEPSILFFDFKSKDLIRGTFQVTHLNPGGETSDPEPTLLFEDIPNGLIVNVPSATLPTRVPLLREGQVVAIERRWDVGFEARPAIVGDRRLASGGFVVKIANRGSVKESVPSINAVGSVQFQARQRFGVVAPEKLHFGAVRRGLSRVRMAKVTLASGLPFSILSISSSDPRFTVKPDRSDAQVIHSIEITFNGGLLGSNKASCRISTDAALDPEATCDLEAYCFE